jgi:hypothetical protein
MPEFAKHPDGTVSLLWRPAPEGPVLRVAGTVAAAAGTLLLFTPLLGRSLLEMALLLPVEGILLLAGLNLLAASSRRGRVRSTLHVGSGELEVRSGRGLLAGRQAFGAVDADHLLLSREGAGEEARFRLAVVTRSGPPVWLCGGEADEEALARAGLTFAQGMGLPFVDRRWPDAAGRGLPGRVARLGDDRLGVFVWTYGDRFRPRAALFVLGLLAGASRGLPLLAPALGAGLLLPAAAVVAAGLGEAAHVVVASAVRRVTLRSEAVRVERLWGGLPLMSRTVPFERLAAVLLCPRGPWVSVRFRRDDRKTAATLPFEDPAVAAWLRLTVEQAVHAAAKAGTILPAGGPAR